MERDLASTGLAALYAPTGASSRWPRSTTAKSKVNDSLTLTLTLTCARSVTALLRAGALLAPTARTRKGKSGLRAVAPSRVEQSGESMS